MSSSFHPVTQNFNKNSRRNIMIEYFMMPKKTKPLDKLFFLFIVKKIQKPQSTNPI